MPRKVYFCILAVLSGCGSTIGSLDSFPSGPDVSEATWPLLVDTPAAPEDRLIAGTGEQVAERLSGRRAEAGARLARAEAVQPVSDTLLARGSVSESRSADATGPAVNEADLLARAARLRQRTKIEAATVNEADLLARAELIRQRTSAPVPATTVTASRTLTVPRPPVPLRPLDAPVVSSSFEERARLALKRAASAGT